MWLKVEIPGYKGVLRVSIGGLTPQAPTLTLAGKGTLSQKGTEIAQRRVTFMGLW